MTDLDDNVHRLRFLIRYRDIRVRDRARRHVPRRIGVAKILPRASRGNVYAERWVRAVRGMAQVRLIDE